MKWPWRREAGLVEPGRASATGLNGAGNGQRDTGRGLRFPARCGGRDDTKEDLEERSWTEESELLACHVLPG